MERKVFFANLPYDWGEDDLRAFAQEAGEVDSLQLLLNPDFTSRGSGFVLYADAADARGAPGRLHDAEAGGRRILVQRARDDSFDILVSGLPPHAHWLEVRGVFSVVGRVSRVEFLSRTSAVVRYMQFDKAVRALALHGARVWDDELVVETVASAEGGEWYTPGRGVKSDDFARILLVDHVPQGTSWQDLKDLFRTAGNVTRATVFAAGPSTQRGLVCMESARDAIDAAAVLNGVDLNGSKVDVRLLTLRDGAGAPVTLDAVAPEASDE